ncbi:hypothetical protein [Pseudobacillus badius]|uniref:hypothetical protein n=1 Tax=Bacillus badius TaxID=1455 RepID=UPI0007B3E95F|nr:hypothetical protein [Bacillus badius]KZR57532.1 hypothetical protein A3781_19765 [Bacillus badius]
MFDHWQPRPLAELGDYIGHAVLIICEEGAYKGGLKDITPSDLHIEVGEGEILAISREVVFSENTEFYVAEVNA